MGPQTTEPDPIFRLCCFLHRYASLADLLNLRVPKLVGIVIEVQNDAIVAMRLTILLQLLDSHFARPVAKAGTIGVNL